MLSAIYRLALDTGQRRTFEKIALYCETFINLIPLSFVLGFYVAIVITRWWNQYTSIPWPDRVMLYVSTMIDGNDEQGRLIRRTLMRYLALGSLIVFQATSVRVKKRFPTIDHLIEAGVASKAEIEALDDVSTPHGKWWIPFVWCCNLIKHARKQGRIADNYLLKSLIDEISAYRGSLGMLYSYDWISVPLVYTQVTTLAVYTFFLGCTFGRQYLDPDQNYPGHNIDLYIPFFTILQFFFYMGWLKVAEQLINPFGEDDDDFEMNWIIDRNMQVSLLTTDDLYGLIPPLEKDLYYGEPPPDYLPYTKSSIKGISQPHMGSTVDIRVSDEGMKVLSPLETIQEGVALRNPNHASSYVNTPRRSTPIASPNPVRYQNQNFMSGGMRSPSDVFSRLSLHSFGKGIEDGGVGGHAVAGSSVISRATEKLGRWLIDHSSRTDLSSSSRAFHSNFTRQASAAEDLAEQQNADESSVTFARDLKNGGSLPSSKLPPVVEVSPGSIPPVQCGASVLIEINEQTRKNGGGGNFIFAAQEADFSTSKTSEMIDTYYEIRQMENGHSPHRDRDFDCTLGNGSDENDVTSVQNLSSAHHESTMDGSGDGPSPRNRMMAKRVSDGGGGGANSTLMVGRFAMENVTPCHSHAKVKVVNGDLPSNRYNVVSESSYDAHPMPLIVCPELRSRSVDIPAVMISENTWSRRCSEAEYETPESNQCTVTSMTPLLTSDHSSDYVFNMSTPTDMEPGKDEMNGPVYSEQDLIVVNK